MGGDIELGNTHRLSGAAGITMTGSITAATGTAITFGGQANSVVNGVYTDGNAGNGNITENNIAILTKFTSGITVTGTTTFNTDLTLGSRGINSTGTITARTFVEISMVMPQLSRWCLFDWSAKY